MMVRQNESIDPRQRRNDGVPGPIRDPGVGRWTIPLWVVLVAGCFPVSSGDNDDVVSIPVSGPNQESDGGPITDGEFMRPPVNIGDDGDGDGLGDTAEAVVETDPADPDSDGDGVGDGQEFTLGSNPNMVDTDGDGRSDGEEVADGTDPVRADTDGDGFSDTEEHAADTDPVDRFNWPFGGRRWPDLSGFAQGVYADGFELTEVLADLAFQDQFGAMLSLYQFYGYVILIDFSAGWCGPCRETAGGAQAMWTRYRDRGFMIIHLLTESGRPGDPATPALLTEWAEAYGLEFPVVLQDDGAAYSAFQTSEVYGGALPFLVLVDREMRIDSSFGANSEAAVEARLEALLDAPVTPRAHQGGPGPQATTEICDQDGDGALNTSCGGLDCRDHDPAIFPAQTEQCDAVDRNCDGLIHADAVDMVALYRDTDADGFGDPSQTVLGCQAYWPYVLNADDCDDTDPRLNPNTVWYRDMDRDGAGDPGSTTVGCTQPDGYVANDQDADDTEASAGCWGSVTVGRDHACALRTDGSLACWGAEPGGVLAAPAGADFVAVSAGYRHTCALRDSGAVACWGSPTGGATTPPDDVFTAISCGLGFCCGLTTAEGDNLRCWGNGAEGQTSPPSGHFLEVSAGGGRHACAIDGDAQLQCWGLDEGFRGEPSPLQLDPGDYAQVSAAHYMTCAVTTDGEGRCVGANAHGQGTPPAGAYTQLSAGTVHSCGLTTEGAVRCFGSQSLDRCAAPDGRFVQVDANQLHSCAVTDTGLIRCWGSTEDGRTRPPSCVR